MSPARLNADALPLAAKAIIVADAMVGRVGGGKSLGSRGTKTYTAPTATKTAKHAAQIEDSMTDRRVPAAASAEPSHLRGLSGLLLGELIAAVNAIRRRSQLVLAPARGSASTPNRSSYIFTYGPTAPALPLSIGKEDFDCFERLLGEIQTAYGRGDTEGLGARTTPEMFSHFSRDLHDNARRGRRNDLRDVKLLGGELSETWSENGSDYATVAMRYFLVDAMVDRETGTLIAGDAIHPSEATELWTFRRDDRAHARGWELSAIQQAAQGTSCGDERGKAWPVYPTASGNRLCRSTGRHDRSGQRLPPHGDIDSAYEYLAMHRERAPSSLAITPRRTARHCLPLRQLEILLLEFLVAPP